MKNMKNFVSIRRSFICLTVFLLISSMFPFSKVNAANFPCTTVDEIREALREAERNNESDIIFVAPGEYNIWETLVYRPLDTENHRLLIGGLPWDKPIFNGMESTRIMLVTYIELDGGVGDSNADVWISDIVFSNGYVAHPSEMLTSGGLNVWTFESDIRVSNCLFQNNFTLSGMGGGAFLFTSKNGNITVENSVFTENESRVYNGGGLGILAWQLCNINVINNTFVFNFAGDPELGLPPDYGWGGGAAIKIYDETPDEENRTLNINNNIFSWNFSKGEDLDILDPIGAMEININNNVISADTYYNRTVFTDWGFSNYWDVSPSINTDDFTLEPGSNCIDSGYDTPGYHWSFSEFYGRHYRIEDGDGDGTFVVDRGATEYRMPGDSYSSPRYYRFLPGFPSNDQEFNFPKGPVYYLELGDIAKNSDKRVGWTISNNRYLSSGYCLYYGDPAVGNYAIDQKRNTGSFTIKDIDLKDSNDPAFSFMLYMDTESGNKKDILKVWANDKLLWEKNKQTVVMKKWQMIEIGLKDFTGQTISLKVEFDTLDSKNNLMEGLYIDEFTVY